LEKQKRESAQIEMRYKCITKLFGKKTLFEFILRIDSWPHTYTSINDHLMVTHKLQLNAE